MIPSDLLLTLLQAYHLAAAPSGGTFSSRGALILRTPLAKSRPSVSHLKLSDVPWQAQWTSESPAYSFVYRVSFASPDGSFRRGRRSALCARQTRPEISCFLQPPSSLVILHLPVSRSPRIFCSPDGTFWRGNGASPP